MNDLQTKPKLKTEPDVFTSLPAPIECLVCGSNAVRYESDYPSNVEPFASKQVVYCTDCGSGTVPGSAALLQSYYEVDYATLNRRDREAPPEQYFSTEFRDSSKKIARYFSRGTRHVDTLKSFGVTLDDVLDYGSGPGYFLHVSGATRKYAFEPDSKSAKYLEYLGAKRFSQVGEISQYKYDGIVASHSIEHLVPEELTKVLGILLNSLKENGKLLIEVPHGGHTYLHLDARQDPHTIFFTPEGICRAVEVAGGRVLYHTTAAKTVAPLRADPIYTPKAKPFYKEQRGSMVVVCEPRDGSTAAPKRKAGWRRLFA